MMKFLWTKSTLPFSGIERWVLQQDCSHMQILFPSYDTGLVFDIYYTGTRVRFLKDVLASCQVIHEMPLDLTPEQENAVYDLLVEKFNGQKYAFRAALYLGWRKLLGRWFGLPIPKTNPYLEPGEMFCNMVGGVLSAIGLDVSGELSGMMSPHDVWVAFQGLNLKPGAAK